MDVAWYLQHEWVLRCNTSTSRRMRLAWHAEWKGEKCIHSFRRKAWMKDINRKPYI
jgi:hypothetical protein